MAKIYHGVRANKECRCAGTKIPTDLHDRQRIFSGSEFTLFAIWPASRPSDYNAEITVSAVDPLIMSSKLQLSSAAITLYQFQFFAWTVANKKAAAPVTMVLAQGYFHFFSSFSDAFSSGQA